MQATRVILDALGPTLKKVKKKSEVNFNNFN